MAPRPRRSARSDGGSVRTASSRATSARCCTTTASLRRPCASGATSRAWRRNTRSACADGPRAARRPSRAPSRLRLCVKVFLIAGLHPRLQVPLSARAWCAGRRRRGRHYLPARGADAGVPKHHAESAADPRGGASGGSDRSEPAAGPAQPAEARGRKAARRGHASAAARSAQARGGGAEPSALQAAGGEAAGRDGAARHPLSHGASSWA